jgi:hypothetical protein
MLKYSMITTRSVLNQIPLMLLANQGTCGGCENVISPLTSIQPQGGPLQRAQPRNPPPELQPGKQ